MSDLRIFSYLPNPRIWKATIAGRLCGVDVEVRGSSPKELQSWLWDFDAHPLSGDELATSADSRTGKVGFSGTLHKTDAFMQAHPFGTVPAAFSPDGKVGIFESNSIMRTVARLGEAASDSTDAMLMKRRASTAFSTRVWSLRAIRRSTSCHWSVERFRLRFIQGCVMDLRSTWQESTRRYRPAASS